MKPGAGLPIHARRAHGGHAGCGRHAGHTPHERHTGTTRDPHGTLTGTTRGPHAIHPRQPKLKPLEIFNDL